MLPTFMQQPAADLLVQAATAAIVAGNVGQAASLLDRALVADPRHPMALTKQAELAMLRKDHVRALRLIEAALTVEANFAPAWNQRASALWAAGCHQQALEAARRAVSIQPPNPEFRLRLAQFAAWTGRGAETRDVLSPMLETGSDGSIQDATAIAMLGELAIAEGRFAEAVPYLDQALAMRPDLAVTRMLRGMNRLRLGRFREGWADYAVREGILGLYPDAAETLADRVWQGEDLTGKTLLVTDDQGHGDAIQFVRYLPLLRDRDPGAVTWRTFPPLVRLLADSVPYATVVNALPAGAWFDFQCNSTSLPRIFETEPGTIPVGVPYLRPPRRLKSAMKRPAGRPLQVGLVWSGDARHSRDHLRSIPASLFLRLAELPGISFHSLQHEIRSTDLAAVAAGPAIGREVEKAADFADTAALIDRLDLVIAVDTGIAHLAGALGKPVWLILHVAPDWRWLADRSDSPWYPTMRLFRVTPAENRDGVGWKPVLDRVRRALSGFARRAALAGGARTA
ncbi:MAG TPA: tetratricopeptide repeat protein [Rhodopila sp.]|nr:tetratricopeptide repeat protein [Rhodopila sp.]